MNIGFWDNQLCERGSTVALFDYAYYNQTLLGNKSFIFYDKNKKKNRIEVIEKFKKYFTVHETDNFKEVDEYLVKYNITHMYIIKSGEKDNRISKVAKNCIHCVLSCKEHHGDIYSSISPYVDGNNGKYHVVPHMINLPTNIHNNMREQLNIPKNAIVFGGYGGKDCFSIRFVQRVVYQVALKFPNIYFLFANFHKFCPELPNIIHLPMIVDLDKKVEFIKTTDAMLCARKGGENFGLAIGEFSTLNKPVIATKIDALTYWHILGSKGIWYSNQEDLYNILTNFNPEIESNKDWNAYQEYSPEKVMEIFKKVYLD